MAVQVPKPPDLKPNVSADTSIASKSAGAAGSATTSAGSLERATVSSAGGLAGAGAGATSNGIRSAESVKAPRVSAPSESLPSISPPSTNTFSATTNRVESPNLQTKYSGSQVPTLGDVTEHEKLGAPKATVPSVDTKPGYETPAVRTESAKDVPKGETGHSSYDLGWAVTPDNPNDPNGDPGNSTGTAREGEREGTGVIQGGGSAPLPPDGDIFPDLNAATYIKDFTVPSQPKPPNTGSVGQRDWPTAGGHLQNPDPTGVVSGGSGGGNSTGTAREEEGYATSTAKQKGEDVTGIVSGGGGVPEQGGGLAWQITKFSMPQGPDTGSAGQKSMEYPAEPGVQPKPSGNRLRKRLPRPF